MAANVERKKVDTSLLKGKPILWVMGKISIFCFC
jgi:hypothetical protein